MEWNSVTPPPGPYPVAPRRQFPHFGGRLGRGCWGRGGAGGGACGRGPLPLAIRPWVHRSCG